jgi:hypothetical protein
MNWLGKFTDDVAASALTKLAVLLLAAWLGVRIWRERLTGTFWAGYVIGSAILVWLMVTRVNPVIGDKVSEKSNVESAGEQARQTGMLDNSWLKWLRANQ